MVNRKIKWFFLGIILTALFLQNPVRAAYGDLLLGRASLFDSQLKQRYETIGKCKSDTCVVAPLSVNLASLWYNDIDTNASGNENIRYSIFFGKKAIRLSYQYRITH